MAIVFLQLQNISKAFGDEEIIIDATVQVREGECFGLIGPNGAGKSTLFRIITGEEYADRGEVCVPKGIRIGYLQQDAEAEPGRTVREELLESRDDLMAISTRMHELEAAMAAPGAHDDQQGFDRMVSEHVRLAEEFHRLGGDTLESDAMRILRGLGLDESFDTAEVTTLSGGQKRRLALAKLLLAAPDLMLLDEPTNHLDLAAITWLEDYIRAYRGGVLIVSHDRYLLDRVCDHVAEIEDTRLRQFDGNYSAYHAKKEAENDMLAKKAVDIARERARLQESIQTLFSHRKFTRMRSLQKQLYKLEQVTLPGESDKSKMAFTCKRTSGRETLTVRGVRKRYTDAPLLEGVDFTVWRKERVALLGPNGCGKTTLLRTLVGELAADGGEIIFGHQVDRYYYDQEGRNLDPRNTVMQEVWGANPELSPAAVRGALARFLIFAEDCDRPISTLSGGERSRVSLTKMFLSGANLLILDEPTNHLDIEGKESLEGALADYPGTVLMVSHDRYFIDRVASRVLEFDNGRVKEYHGNYTDYLRKKAEDLARAAAEAEANRAPAPKPKPAASTPTEKPKRRSLQYYQRQQGVIEERIAALELQKEELEALLADPSIYADGLRAKGITEDHQNTQDALTAAYAEWEEIAEAIVEQELEAEAEREARLARR